jgi:hypothetical protein
MSAVFGWEIVTVAGVAVPLEDRWWPDGVRDPIWGANAAL